MSKVFGSAGVCWILVTAAINSFVRADDVSDRIKTLLLNAADVSECSSVCLSVETLADRKVQGVASLSAFGRFTRRVSPYGFRIECKAPSGTDMLEFIQEHILDLPEGPLFATTSDSSGSMRVHGWRGVGGHIRRMDPCLLCLATTTGYAREAVKVDAECWLDWKVLHEEDTDGGLKVWFAAKEFAAGGTIVFSKEPNWLPVAVRFIQSENKAERASTADDMKQWNVIFSTDTRWVRCEDYFVPEQIEMSMTDDKRENYTFHRFKFADWKLNDHVDLSVLEKSAMAADLVGSKTDFDKIRKLFSDSK